MAELDSILYGKKKEVKLADGKTYILREPDLGMLSKIKFNTGNIDDIESIKRLISVMLKQDNEGITDQIIDKLVTFRMLQPKHEFMQSVLEVAGIGEGNEEAGKA